MYRKIDYFPNTLPRDFWGLHGRNNELNLVINAIIKQKSALNTVIISSFDGMPAVGKTTLAVRVAHMLSTQYLDAQLFIDCYGYTSGHDPLNKEQILDSLLFALRIPATRIPEKYIDKLSLWRLELNHKSVIIVFDNVKNESQVDELIPSSTNSLFIITSRNKLLINDCYHITVDVLDSDASVLILNGNQPEKDKTRYDLLSCLAKKYGNLPLALQIISHQIKGKSNKYIQRLINNNRNRLENLGAFNNSVYLSFDISYEKLRNSEQFLFQVLGLFPGFDFSASSCAAMIGVNTDKVYNSLDILFQEKLIKEVGDERYVLHDLMRDFSREKYYKVNGNNHQPLIRLLKYYIEYIIHCNNILYPYNYRENIRSGYIWKIDDLPSNQNDALNWLRIELENILSSLDMAIQHKWYILYFKLSYVLSQYIMKSLPGWKTIKIYQNIINYEKLDTWMRVATETNLALAYSQTGRFDIAVSTFVKAEKSWKKLNNRKALTYTLGNHAFTLERLGKYTDALEIIEEALKYTIAENDLSGMASILNSKGAVYWRLHQYPKARIIFEKVIAIRRQFGDKYGASNSINNLAFTLLRMGDEQAARKGFAESLKLSNEIQDYSGEAVTLNNLGYTELFSNQPHKAIDYAQDAFNIANQIGNEYQVARSYDVKGNAYLKLCDKESALINFEIALKIFDELNVPEANEVKIILNKLNR